MRELEYHIPLDCRREDSQVTVTARVGEAASRKLVFFLKEGRKTFAVPSGATAIFRAKKPSGAVLYNSCSIVNGCIEYVITTQTVAESGVMACEIEISDGGKILFSPKITLVVQQTLVSDSEVESSDEYSELEKLIAEAKNKEITVWYPSVSTDGVISWSRSASETAPASISVKGPKGDKGDVGAKGDKGDKGDAGAESGMIVNCTYNAEAQNYTVDKSFDEIVAAIKSGKLVMLRFSVRDYLLESAYLAGEQQIVIFSRLHLGDHYISDVSFKVSNYTTDTGSNVTRSDYSVDFVEPSSARTGE